MKPSVRRTPRTFAMTLCMIYELWGIEGNEPAGSTRCSPCCWTFFTWSVQKPLLFSPLAIQGVGNGFSQERWMMRCKLVKSDKNQEKTRPICLERLAVLMFGILMNSFEVKQHDRWRRVLLERDPLRAVTHPYPGVGCKCRWAMNKGSLVVCWVYRWWNTIQLNGDYFINHEIMK